MAKKRRIHTAEFKFKIVLEVLKGDKTLNQIASEQKLIPNQISQWKREFLDQGASVFKKGPDKDKDAFRKKEAQMERKIGQLTLSVDFLKKKVDPFFDPRSLEDD